MGNNTTNPFVQRLDDVRESLLELVQNPQFLADLESLPSGEERIEAVRRLNPADYSNAEGFRISPRWFEHDSPMEDTGAARYVYVDGHPPGSPRPRPPRPRPGGGGDDWTVCGSVGTPIIPVCGSVGK